MRNTTTAVIVALALALTGCAAQEETTGNIGATLDVNDPELEDAFIACRNSNALTLQDYEEPEEHEPKFAFEAGDDVVVVGLTFNAVRKGGGLSALKQVLATCSMRYNEGQWQVAYKADMIPVVGGSLG